MSPAEVGFRVRRKVQSAAERCGIGLAREAPVPQGASGKPWLARLPRSFDKAKYVAAAQRVLAGRFDVFALRAVQIGFPPRWNVDPKTRIEAPLPFGKALQYREPSLVGDIKYLWEINRHLELVTLAQAWHLAGDDRYAHGCRALLDSWFAQCPYPRGAHWCVSLEHAVRLVNWSFAWHLLGGEDACIFRGVEGKKFRQRWLLSIYQHCHFIARHWSRHSSANNHLLGEAAGLFVGAVTWPLWRLSGHWSAVAQRELRTAALAQTGDDGVNKEQAVWYHHAVADMMLIAGLVGRANQRDFGDEYWQRLHAMLVFLCAVMDVNGNVPAIGDADEGVLVRFMPGDEQQPGNTDVFRSLLATGAVLYGDGGLRRKVTLFDDKSRWLLGDAAEAHFHALQATACPQRHAFPAGGYFILGERFDTPREVRIVADAGPLGFLSIAAHGHADALAFTLSAAGCPILVDVGTFAYHTEARWRRYFKGTSAHNTVAVDRQDQSVFGGNFLWLSHAVTRVESLDESAGSQSLAASHDGYGRLADPVRHTRRWQYQESGPTAQQDALPPVCNPGAEPAVSTLIISDALACGGTHRIDIFWHFAPECVVTQRGNTICAARGPVKVELQCPDGLLASLVRGLDSADEGPLGWYSSGFDVKVPTTTAVFSGQITGVTRLDSTLRISVA